jgi:LysR family glycine cleavage system transcriptional activator
LDTSLTQLAESGFGIDVALLHDDLPEGVIGARFLPHARAPLNRLFLTAWKSFSILKPSPSCPDPAPMSYRLPPLNGLRAFEAAGRHLSFKAAAMELSVTPGAVSQQVKHLEQALGVPLFQRLHRSLILTAQGEALLPEVADAFERLSEASDTVAKALKTKPLRLGISPALSDEPDRLLARLAGTKRPPDYVRAVATDDVADLLAGRLDALLRPGPGPYPGLHAEVLALAPGFGAHKKASLVVWPGLARCREFTRARALLVKD